MFAKRWQLKTTDTCTGDELCTTEMPNLEALGLPGLGYRFESCLFTADGDSRVQDRYDTREEAEAGHQRLVMRLMGAALPTEHGVTQED